MKTIIAIAAIAITALGFSTYANAQNSATTNNQNFAGSCCSFGEEQSAPVVRDTEKAGTQTICPIMGNKLTSKKLYVDYKGMRIYVCCPPCVNEVKKDPEAAIKKIQSNGETVEILKK